MSQNLPLPKMAWPRKFFHIFFAPKTLNFRGAAPALLSYFLPPPSENQNFLKRDVIFSWEKRLENSKIFGKFWKNFGHFTCENLPLPNMAPQAEKKSPSCGIRGGEGV